MNLSRWKKAVLGIVGAILIGAIGSGLWDVGVKPGGRWLGRAILDVATLGSASVKDATYREAARGYHEEAVLEIYSMFLGLITGFVFGIPIFMRPRKSRPTMLVRSPQDMGSDDLARLALERKRAFELQTRRRFRLFYMSELLVLLMVSFLFVKLLKTNQANRACTFYSQSMAICRPYIDERQAQMLASQFAGIQGRADYIGIVDELRRIAASNHRQLPDYQPW